MDRNGRFSWRRLITNAVPNFARDDINDVDLTPSQADNLIRWQLSTSAPPYLTEEAFFVAALTDSKTISRKIHCALVKHNLVAPAPATARSSQASHASARPPPSFAQPVPPVHTARIGRDLVAQLAFISVHAQRKLVGLLFFWEEECMRWKLLEQEEAEILNAMGQERTDNDDLDVALRAVEMKRALLPSLRGEATANISQGVSHELPGYSR
jgi:hypothetical protein